MKLTARQNRRSGPRSLRLRRGFSQILLPESATGDRTLRSISRYAGPIDRADRILDSAKDVALRKAEAGK